MGKLSVIALTICVPHKLSALALYLLKNGDIDVSCIYWLQVCC